jgi:hypothetical protein
MYSIYRRNPAELSPNNSPPVRIKKIRKYILSAFLALAFEFLWNGSLCNSLLSNHKTQNVEEVNEINAKLQKLK